MSDQTLKTPTDRNPMHVAIGAHNLTPPGPAQCPFNDLQYDFAVVPHGQFIHVNTVNPDLQEAAANFLRSIHISCSPIRTGGSLRTLTICVPPMVNMHDALRLVRERMTERFSNRSFMGCADYNLPNPPA